MKNIIVVITLILASTVFYFYLNAAPAANTKTLTYQGITIKAPNTIDRPYYVFAMKGNKKIWELNSKAYKLTDKQKRDLKAGGIEKLVIQNVKDSDLDSGATNYSKMKRYIGKPELYIYYSKYSVINRLSSWLIVDIYTGKEIAFIAFN